MPDVGGGKVGGTGGGTGSGCVGFSGSGAEGDISEARSFVVKLSPQF